MQASHFKGRMAQHQDTQPRGLPLADLGDEAVQPSEELRDTVRPQDSDGMCHVWRVIPPHGDIDTVLQLLCESGIGHQVGGEEWHYGLTKEHGVWGWQLRSGLALEDIRTQGFAQLA